MAITAINPGRVYPPIQARGQWTYSIEYVRPSGSQMVSAGVTYSSASEAGQKMREEVCYLRQRHAVQGAIIQSREG